MLIIPSDERDCTTEFTMIYQKQKTVKTKKHCILRKYYRPIEELTSFEAKTDFLLYINNVSYTLSIQLFSYIPLITEYTCFI